MDIASNLLTLISSIFIVLSYDEDHLDLFVIAASAKEVVGLWEIQRANELWQRDNQSLCRLFHDNSHLCHHDVNLPRKIYFLAPPGALRIIPTYFMENYTNLTQLWHNFYTTVKHFQDNVDTISGLFWENLETALRQLWHHKVTT